MRTWARATWQFVCLAFGPLRHTEELVGWGQFLVSALTLLLPIATASLGAIFEDVRWLLTIVTPSLVALLFLIAGVRLHRRLIREPFYIRIWSIRWKMLCREPFEEEMSIGLMISNQQDNPRGISRFVLETEMPDGGKKELDPVPLTNRQEEVELTAPLYLQPGEPRAGWVTFVHDTHMEHKMAKLYLYDDYGGYRAVAVTADTMAQMARKSMPRSGP